MPIPSVASAAAAVEPLHVVLSAVLFFVGYAASYPAVVHEVSLLTWYPLWIWRHVRGYISPDDAWTKLFVFLLVFNASSLLVNLLSGFLVVAPPVLAALLGLNVGVISVEEAGTAGLVCWPLNPVAWLELPAAFVSLGAGIQLAASILESGFVAGASSWFLTGGAVEPVRTWSAAGLTAVVWFGFVSLISGSLDQSCFSHWPTRRRC